MIRKHFDNVVDILECSDNLHLADSLEMIEADDIEAISEMADNMRTLGQPEEQVTAFVMHDVAGLLENEVGFTPKCAAYRLQY